MNKVSILLVSYNNSKFLKKVINSILEQTFNNFELLILDNGSTDNSLEILNKYVDKRIKIYSETKNLGPEGCWNYLFKKSKGEYIRITCSDDLMHESCIEKQVFTLDNNSDIDFVFTNIQVIDNKYKNVPNYTQTVHLQDNRFEYLKYGFYKGNPFLTPTFMGRSSMFEKDGFLMEERRSYFGDYTTWLRLMLRGYRPYVIEEFLVYSIKDCHNMTAFNSDKKKSSFTFALNNYLDVYCEIKSIEDLEKIIPEVKEYTKRITQDDVDLIPFIVAMAAFKVKNVEQFKSFSQSHTIFALNKIYQIFTNRNLAKKIEDVFQFNYFDFVRMTQEYPILKNEIQHNNDIRPTSAKSNKTLLDRIKRYFFY